MITLTCYDLYYKLLNVNFKTAQIPIIFFAYTAAPRFFWKKNRDANPLTILNGRARVHEHNLYYTTTHHNCMQMMNLKINKTHTILIPVTNEVH